MNYLIINISLYDKLANEIIDINKGNLRTKRKCLTLNYLKSYHANVIENRALLKFKVIFKPQIKRKRKRIIFFKRKYFVIKNLKKFSYKKFFKKPLKRKRISHRYNNFLVKMRHESLNNANNAIYKGLLKKFRK